MYLFQGSPVFLDNNGCDTYIEWYSSVACQKSVTASFVPCYVYGSKTQRYDLSPLIKSKGAYRVETMDDSDFFINVCRDITPGKDALCLPILGFSSNIFHQHKQVTKVNKY